MAGSPVQEVINKVMATKKVTTCIHELVEQTVEEMTADEDEDILVIQHTIMVSLLKVSGSFECMGLSAPDARGAIAEVMCTYMLGRWLESRNITGGVVNGVMLKVYPNTPGREDTTEIDVVLVTDRFLCIIECKSFKGDKVTDGNYVTTKNIQKQPWQQNQGHVVAFKNNCKKDLANIKLPRIFNVVYMFCEGKFTEWKQPDDANQKLLFNLGAFKQLDDMYDACEVSNSSQDIKQILDWLQAHEPTVEDQTEHILRIKKLL